LTESVREEIDRSTKLAFDRTYLAEERTILAWIRTATSLITFGFAIFSFLEFPTEPDTLTPHISVRAFSRWH
jgi:putative membrane protein